MICCSDVPELLDSVFEPTGGRLLPPVEAHVATCPGCAALLSTLRQTIAMYRKYEPGDLPPEVRSRLAARLAAELSGRPPGGGTSHTQVHSRF